MGAQERSIGRRAVNHREQRLGEVFVELADTLVADFDIVDLLHTLVEAIVELLEVEAAGLMLADQRGGLRPIAASDQQARLLELLELQHQQGPCVDCHASGERVANMAREDALGRWPEFMAAVEESGYQSVHALPMRLRGQILGAVNLFCDSEAALAESDLALGQAMADLATIALLQERRVEENSILVEQLQTALNTRVVIEQAKGMLAERAGFSPASAFTAMRAHARRTNQTLLVVAEAVISGTVRSSVVLDQGSR